MGQMYATITSKGQITLPVEARRALGLRQGQKVEVRIEGTSLVIDAPLDIRELRKRARAEAEAAGTWGSVPTQGDGWAAQVTEQYGPAGNADD